MAKKHPAPSSISAPTVIQAPRSRREELLDSLVAGTAEPIHLRILQAYRSGGTVQDAEQEFQKIIHEIVDET